jgi:hypothetical protein
MCSRKPENLSSEGIPKEKKLYAYTFLCPYLTTFKLLLKMTVFCDAAPCSLVEVNRRFRGKYCLYHQGDDGGSTLETTRPYNPVSCHLPTCRRENLNYYIIIVLGLS